MSLRQRCVERLRSAALIAAAQVAVVLLGTGCYRPSPPAGDGSVAEVWFDGCTAVRRGSGSEAEWVCERDPAEPLRLWVARPEGAEVELFFRQRPLAAVPEARPAAVRFQLDLDSDLEPGSAVRLVVVVSAPGSVARWELGIEPPSELSETYRRALTLSAREPGRAREIAEAALETVHDSADRARLFLLLARIERKSGRYDQAERRYREAFAGFASGGNRSEQILAGVLLFHLCFYDREHNAAAEAALDALPPPPPGDVDSAYRTAFYPALWAVNTGRYRLASQQLDRALAEARRFGDEAKEIYLQQMRAPLLSRFGRYREAVDLLLPLEQSDVIEGCAKAQLVQNVAWNQLLAWEAWGGPARARLAGLEAVAEYAPIPRLERALELLAAPECEDDERVNVAFNLALAHFHRGSFDRAEAQLEMVPGEGKAWYDVWSLDLRGRLALVRGHPAEALGAYELLAALAGSRESPDARWRAAVGRARALRALGHLDEALRAFAIAEDLVQGEMLAVPVGGERETSLQARAAGTREHLDLLLERKAERRALELARRAHSRALRGLLETHRIAELDRSGQREWAEISDGLRRLDEQEASDWTVAGERYGETVAARRKRRQELLDRAHLLLGGGLFSDPGLPHLRDDELTLLYHPLPGGWAGFAVRGEEIVVRRIPRRRPVSPGSGTETADLFLAPFASELVKPGYRQIRVLAPGELSMVDFQALPFRGQPLVALAPVIYGLDLVLPERGRRAAVDPAGGGAGQSPGPLPGKVLLVVDPRRNLQDAQAEGDAVAAALGSLAGPDDILRLDHGAATLERVRTGLGESSMLHFVGHADFSGHAGWDSGIALAGDTRLTAPSLLALPAVPRTVVLSACESSASSAGPTEGLGLARAFVLAGSREVLGTVRPVADATSRAVAEELYRQWDGRGPLAEALRRAQLALAAAGSVEDWQAFRVVER